MALLVTIRCENLMLAGEACGHLTPADEAGGSCPFYGGSIAGMPVVYGVEEQGMAEINQRAADRLHASEPNPAHPEVPSKACRILAGGTIASWRSRYFHLSFRHIEIKALL